jgi:hypothetical protein
MRFCLLSSCVPCAMLCLYKFLFLLLWFPLLLFVALMQVFWAVSTLVVLVGNAAVCCGDVIITLFEK